jgi:hypothetical protein
MKTKHTVFAGVLSLIALLAPHLSRAASDAAGMADGLGTWEGTGTAAEVSGKDLGAFNVAVTRTLVGNGKVRADGKVTLASGRVITFWQEFEEHGPKGFGLVSSNGAGGGQCFDNGMCTLYEQSPNGHAFATTLVKDGPEKLRVLTTELDKGQAVRFTQQTLQKKR